MEAPSEMHVKNGTRWLDTTQDPPVLRVWRDGDWREATRQPAQFVVKCRSPNALAFTVIVHDLNGRELGRQTVQGMTAHGYAFTVPLISDEKEDESQAAPPAGDADPGDDKANSDGGGEAGG